MASGQEGSHERIGKRRGCSPHADRHEVHEIVGVQLQASALPAKLRVGEILDMYRSFYRDPADISELLDVLGLAGKRTDYYKSLSGGQRQRLSIALALIGRPRIAVLDEMTTGLDPQARRDVWELIEGVRDSGVTILLVTHFMEEAERLCDRVALIDNGRIAALDTPSNLAVKARGGKSVRFLPSAPFDDRVLTELPEVSRVEREGQHVVVTGTGELVNAVLFSLATFGLPIPLVTYRELGVLRRLSTTPVPPSWLLAAQAVVQLCVALAGTAVLVVVAVTVFGAAPPKNPGEFALSVLLSIAGLLPIGLMIAAIARTANAASVIGRLAFFPMMFFAGLWLPRELMPAVLLDISNYTPLGAAVEAMQDSMLGGTLPVAPLLVLAAYAVVFGFLARRFFRWE